MNAPYSFQLKHDQNGRIIEKTETTAGAPVVWTYVYDAAGRLTEAALDGRRICQCWYDRQGRRVEDCFPATHGPSIRRFAYRMDNRLQSAGNNTFTHDENGFRCIWNHEGQYTTYEYAPDHRLLQAEKKADNAVFEFTHDDSGQREFKRRNGRIVEAYGWLDFLRLAGFHDGEVGYRFHYAEGERTPHAMEREDGAVAHLFYDQVGSLRVVADGAGDMIKEILYDPFGGIINDTNPDLRIPIGFAGGLHDRDLGFVRFGWRDYDTFTGRWTAPDPIGDAGGDPDWYGYCLDDPVNMSDPLGLFGAWLAEKLTKKVHKVINPMSPERIIKEEAQKEIERLQQYGDTNSTAVDRIKKMEQLQQNMDKEGLPSPMESFKKHSKRKTYGLTIKAKKQIITEDDTFISNCRSSHRFCIIFLMVWPPVRTYRIYNCLLGYSVSHKTQ